ncbi:hypothetical protein [Alkalihalobacillus sp. CinArs1]|uniref:hypothetical protein n=1 Tax=Alkalihalobacillus sp. CinArs1 TaxID=2995314 RepID=UPI0022DD2257|nr:hypothetical protein [Alkalihalobacillus sp. CinArs1]
MLMDSLGRSEALNIGQASIYLDACFLLKLADKSDPLHNDIVQLAKSWGSNDSIVGISSHVYGEVVHNLFIRIVLEAIYLREKQKQGATLTTRQVNKIVDTSLVDRLIGSCSPGELAQYVSHVDLTLRRITNNRNVRFSMYNRGMNITYLIKGLKRNPDYIESYRGSIKKFYEKASALFDTLMYTVVKGYKLRVSMERSDLSCIQRAKYNIDWYQLDAHDAIHLAIAMKNGYEYFVTTDSDYFLSSYVPNLKATKLIIIA